MPSSLTHAGFALHRKGPVQNFAHYIRECKGWMNLVAIPLVIEDAAIVSPTPAILEAAHGYEQVVVTLGREIWDASISPGTREVILMRLAAAATPWHIDRVVAVDEPWTGEMYSRTQDLGGLEAMVEEVHAVFAPLGKQVGVNFNLHGLRRARDDGLTIPNTVDFVAVDAYPCNHGATWNDEASWKWAVRRALHALRLMTPLPATYVAQGWGGPGCLLTADNVRWTCEALRDWDLEGICWWFPQEKIGGLRGFFNPHFAEARAEIERQCRLVTMEHHSQG